MRTAPGFTLVEMLAALALAALIVAAITGGFSLGRRVWEHDRASDRRGELEAAVRAVSQTIATAYPMSALGPDGRSLLVFDGQPDSLQFIALSDGTAQIGGLIKTRVGLTRDGTAMRLSLATTPYRVGATAGAVLTGLRDTTVVHGVSGLRFAYFGRFAPDQEPGWTDTWSHATRQPDLVVMCLKATTRAGPVEIPVTVALRQQ